MNVGILYTFFILYFKGDYFSLLTINQFTKHQLSVHEKETVSVQKIKLSTSSRKLCFMSQQSNIDISSGIVCQPQVDASSGDYFYLTFHHIDFHSLRSLQPNTSAVHAASDLYSGLFCYTEGQARIPRKGGHQGVDKSKYKMLFIHHTINAGCRLENRRHVFAITVS